MKEPYARPPDKGALPELLAVVEWHQREKLQENQREGL
jgi:hypothetical protein